MTTGAEIGTQRCGLTESGCAAALEAVDSDSQRRIREGVPMPVVSASLLSPAREVLVRAASAPALSPTSSAPLPSFATPSPLSSASASSPHRSASPPAAQSYPASLFAVSGTGGATPPALPAVDSMETTIEKPNSDHMETCHFVSTCTTPSAGDVVFTSTSTSISTAEVPIPTSGDPGTSTSASSGAAPGSEASPYREARRAAVSAEEFKRDWEVVLITDRFGFRPARVSSFGAGGGGSNVTLRPSFALTVRKPKASPRGCGSTSLRGRSTSASAASPSIDAVSRSGTTSGWPASGSTPTACPAYAWHLSWFSSSWTASSLDCVRVGPG